MPELGINSRLYDLVAWWRGSLPANQFANRALGSHISYVVDIFQFVVLYNMATLQGMKKHKLLKEDILPSMASNRKVQRLLNEFMDLLLEYETDVTLIPQPGREGNGNDKVMTS